MFLGEKYSFEISSCALTDSFRDFDPGAIRNRENVKNSMPSIPLGDIIKFLIIATRKEIMTQKSEKI